MALFSYIFVYITAFCEEIIRLRKRKVAVKNAVFFFIIYYIYTFLKKCVYFSAKGSRKRSEKNNSLFYFCFCDVFTAVGTAGTILRSENKKQLQDRRCQRGGERFLTLSRSMAARSMARSDSASMGRLTSSGSVPRMSDSKSSFPSQSVSKGSSKETSAF